MLYLRLVKAPDINVSSNMSVGVFCHSSWHACSTWMAKDGFIAHGIIMFDELVNLVLMYRN